MSSTETGQTTGIATGDLQRRIHELGRATLEGTRPLSELLGAALAELRSTLSGVRAMEAELERRDREISRLRAKLEAARAPQRRDGPGIGDRSAEVVRPTLLAPTGAASHRTSPARAPLDIFDRPVPDGSAGLEASLRARVAGALFLGTLDVGDRLPSIRELARRTGLNHKVVRRVYRSLEQSGFVEVRDRSGIYVTLMAPQPGEPVDPVAVWTADVVADAALRGLSAGDLPGLLQRSVSAQRLRCACVDSSEDDRFALCREAAVRFGLQTFPVDIQAGVLTADLDSADLVLTTPFHAVEVRKALAPSQPHVIVSLHPALWQAAQEGSEERPLWIVCVDRTAGDRLRHGLGPDLGRRVRVVALDEPAGRAASWTEDRGLATLAAWGRLSRSGPSPNLFVVPYLSEGSIGRIAALLVRLNRQADRSAGEPSANPGEIVSRWSRSSPP